jgi:hypothetical protein
MVYTVIGFESTHRLHELEPAGVDDVVGVLGERYVQRHHVRLAKHVLQLAVFARAAPVERRPPTRRVSRYGSAHFRNQNEWLWSMYVLQLIVFARAAPFGARPAEPGGWAALLGSCPYLQRVCV